MSKFIEAAKKRAKRAEESIFQPLAVPQQEAVIPIESQETQPGEPVVFGPHSLGFIGTSGQPLH